MSQAFKQSALKSLSLTYWPLLAKVHFNVKVLQLNLEGFSPGNNIAAFPSTQVLLLLHSISFHFLIPVIILSPFTRQLQTLFWPATHIIFTFLQVFSLVGHALFYFLLIPHLFLDINFIFLIPFHCSAIHQQQKDVDDSSMSLHIYYST